MKNKPTGVSAVILAAGFGSRLGDLTVSTPKPMLPIGNYPFLAYLTAYLLNNGVDEVLISAAHLKEVIDAYFGADPWRARVTVYQDTPLGGTGTGLLLGTKEAKGTRILMAGGDLIVDFRVQDLIAEHDRQQLTCTFVVSEKSPQNEGAFEVDAHDNLIFSHEVKDEAEVDRMLRAKTESTVSRTSSTGTVLLERSYLDGVPFRQGMSFEQEMLPELIASRQVRTFDIDAGFFYEFGVPERFEFIRTHSELVQQIYGPSLDAILEP